MKFHPERLILVREALQINKAEASRRLNMSPMGYGRYEKGEREPSFQTVSFIASVFGTTTDYLYGLSEDSSSDSLKITRDENPELFVLVKDLLKNKEMLSRTLAYCEKLGAGKSDSLKV